MKILSIILCIIICLTLLIAIFCSKTKIESQPEYPKLIYSGIILKVIKNDSIGNTYTLFYKDTIIIVTDSISIKNLKYVFEK